MEKICTKCGGHGPFIKNSRSKDGSGSLCRACRNSDSRAYLQSNRNFWKTNTPTLTVTKTCSSCGSEGKFGINHSTNDGFNFRCKKCVSENESKYRLKKRSQPCQRMKELVKEVKYNAKHHGHEFDDNFGLSFIENPPKYCMCCSVKLDYSTGKGKIFRNSRGPSLDRLFNDRGYVIGNVFVVCLRCNTVKSAATIKDIENIVSYMQGNEKEIRYLDKISVIKSVRKRTVNIDGRFLPGKRQDENDNLLCVKCGGLGPFDISKRSKDGFSVWCKRCRKEAYVKRHSDPSNRIKECVKAAQKRALQKLLVFEEDLFLLADKPPVNCGCCGIELDYSAGNKGKNNPFISHSPSLDRRNNRIGYTVSNTRIICTRCNVLKGDASIDEMELVHFYMKRLSS